jgi:hypothetical protein
MCLCESHESDKISHGLRLWLRFLGSATDVAFQCCERHDIRGRYYLSTASAVVGAVGQVGSNQWHGRMCKAKAVVPSPAWRSRAGRWSPQRCRTRLRTDDCRLLAAACDTRASPSHVLCLGRILPSVFLEAGWWLAGIRRTTWARLVVRAPLPEHFPSISCRFKARNTNHHMWRGLLAQFHNREGR